jgi:hypothetical protein
MTLTWGAILGVIAVLSTVAAQATIRRRGFLITAVAGFAAAFTVYEGRYRQLAQRRLLEAGGPAVSARGRVDDGAGKRPARVPVTATAPRRVRSLTGDLPGAVVDHLIDLGHLRQADREDRNQVLLALYRGFEPA